MNERARLQALYGELGTVAADRLAQLEPRFQEQPIGDLERSSSQLGLVVPPGLAEVEGLVGGLSHAAPEYGDDESARWIWGARCLRAGGGAVFPRDVASALDARPGEMLVPICAHPDATLFVDRQTAVVGYYPFRRELVEMAESVAIFLRRQLRSWFGSEVYAHEDSRELGEAWAKTLGLRVDSALSDRLEQWWCGDDVVVQQVTRDGDSVWSPARFDRGCDGRFTVLWAVTEERLAHYRSAVATAAR